MARPCPRSRFTSVLHRRNQHHHDSRWSGSDIRLITSNRANLGCLYYVRGPKITSYPSLEELGLNGSFAVFKMIKTDVFEFENFLSIEQARIDSRIALRPNLWTLAQRVPLALSPDTDNPPGGIPVEQMNNFEYVNAGRSGIQKGLRCPVGAHMRRIKSTVPAGHGPRSTGGSNNTHRLIRRGLPYGPVYDPAQTLYGIERGLLGYFLTPASRTIRVRARTLGQWTANSLDP